ncbi:MAG: hypothetical protein ACOC2W_00075 [bacterium]
MESLDEMIINNEEYNSNDVKSNVEKLELYSDNYPFNLPLRISTFDDESLYTKFIKNIEKSVRASIEYKLWTDYIKDVIGVQNCFITNERLDQVKIDIHHHIPSLYILVKAILNKKIQETTEFCSFDIATEAIEVHFKNRVGYVALIKSMHEKFHNGFLRIPINLVKGDFQWFIREYSEYLDQEDLDVINERLTITDSNNNWSVDNYPGVSTGG